MKKQTSGQSIIEYLVILMVILAVLLSERFIASMRGVFDTYFIEASGKIVSP